MKGIIKQFFIILLLCITIVLVFAVLFYDYIPNNKVVPSTVQSYETSNKIKDEIKEEILDFKKQNITLEITDSELKIRKQDHTYESGKVNPFAPAASENNELTNGEILDNNSTVKPEASNHFFEDHGGIK